MNSTLKQNGSEVQDNGNTEDTGIMALVSSCAFNQFYMECE